MNPVENKQPSEWAVLKVRELVGETIVREVLNIDQERALGKELERLKSQADGLVGALSEIAIVGYEIGLVNCQDIAEKALEAYRKGE